MFEDLMEEDDLEWTENRLRVEVLMLKKTGNTEKLFRLYGVIAKVLAQRGDYLKAQDALNDAEFLIVEHKWRGTDKEVWCHHDRAVVFAILGRPGIARTNLQRARELAVPERDAEALAAIEKAELELENLSV
jgi:tetratricopeptide (TPR) repeat protein